MNEISLASLFVILAIPSFFFFSFSEEDWHLGSHFWTFVIFGVLLFFPTFIAFKETIDVLFGYVLIADGSMHIYTLFGWIAFGMLIYWIDFIAGMSMGRLMWFRD